MAEQSDTPLRLEILDPGGSLLGREGLVQGGNQADQVPDRAGGGRAIGDSCVILGAPVQTQKVPVAGDHAASMGSSVGEVGDVGRAAEARLHGGQHVDPAGTQRAGQRVV